MRGGLLSVTRISVLLALAGLLGAPPALAQETGTVTLEASPRRVTFGEQVTLSGAVSPAAAGETVEIVDAETGEILTQATTNGAGAYSVAFEPEASVVLFARSGIASSEQVGVDVLPVVATGLSNVFLFDEALARGHVRPAIAGEKVTVWLMRRTRKAEQVTAPVRSDGSFSARLLVERPGAYRARVEYAPDGYLAARDESAVRTTPLPGLAQGSHAKAVRALELRLDELHYRIQGINQSFDYRTGDAVLAFHKVQGMARVKNVTRATWYRLARPRVPKPVVTRPANHIEIDQTKQVIYVVQRGEIAFIVHTSTGAGGATRDGVFYVNRKIAGYSPNSLYYPSYFDGGRAVHGWPDVPAYPASHGCSRVPYWTAIWLHSIMGYGMQVRVYH